MSKYTPKSKRLGRLITAAPEMYELLRVFAAEPSDAEERIDELCLALNEARKLLARIDGGETSDEDPEV